MATDSKREEPKQFAVAVLNEPNGLARCNLRHFDFRLEADSDIHGCVLGLRKRGIFSEWDPSIAS